ncbi:MAG: SBBP repeat-containing protein, partial [Bacteroidales bacterium]|nr:SBBP repeat-containing protein [Bacteroidales bacterium]
DGTLLWTSEIADATFNAFEWQVKPTYMTIDDNHLYIAGTKFEQGVTDSEMLIFKMDFNGDTLWTATHKGTGIYSNSKSVAVDPSGNVYIAGDAWNTSIDYCVVKFDPDGNLLWDAFYDGQVYNDTDIAQKVIVDNIGNVYITGYNQISSNLTDIVTVKYDQNGNFQWDKSYGNPEYRSNNAYFLETDESGNLYVGGYSAYEDPYPGTGKDYILLKYNPSGNLLWDARWDHFNYLNDHPVDFDMGLDGNVYICGISVKSCFPWEFITVVKYNPQGDLQWNFCIPEMYGTPWEISVINNDEFVVAAGSYDTIMVKDATTIKYDDSNPVFYDNDIIDISFESQIAPPIIDYENHTVIATVYDTVDLQYLVPYIAISDYACIYPDDEDTTSFVVPVWYNVTSFDNVEQWWYVIVEGGYVGYNECKIESLQIYPNPAREKFEVRCSLPNCVSQAGMFEVGHCRMELFDLFGKRAALLFEGKPASGQLEFDVGYLPAGVYICRLHSENQQISKKLIIQK